MRVLIVMEVDKNRCRSECCGKVAFIEQLLSFIELLRSDCP